MEEFFEALKDDWKRELFIFALGGVGGFLVRQFTMSKKERRDDSQMSFENTRDLKRKIEDLRGLFTEQMLNYVEKRTANTLSKPDGFALTRAADAYFEELKLASTAILDKHISPSARDNDFVPLLVEAVQKSLPAYYKAMPSVSKATGMPWGGQLQESNYKGIYAVVRKYASNEVVPKN